MPLKAHTVQRRGRVLHSRHRIQLDKARDSLVLTPLNPTIRRRSPFGGAEMPVAGPSNRPFNNPSLTSAGSSSSSSSSTSSFYTDALPPSPASPAISAMELDTQSSATSHMSIASASDFPDDHSDGSSTVVPMQGIDYDHPQVPAVAYWATANELDNLRNAIHFMHHATILMSNTYNALRAQNPHCHRFPPA
ncbi:hypothetical protein H1R20_g12674, partial [Candolleomyces eurysporus]